MSLPGLLGLLFVVRRQSLQNEVVFTYPIHACSVAVESVSSRYSGRLPYPSLHSEGMSSEGRRENQLAEWDPRSKASRNLAKLLLPPDPLFESGFEIAFDAGPLRQQNFSSLPSNAHKHLRFICYPCSTQREERTSDTDACGFSNSHSCGKNQIHSALKYGRQDDSRNYEKVEKFSVVFMFDSRVPVKANLVDCEATVAKALKISEEKFSHLTIEVKKIFQIINEWTLRSDAKKLFCVSQKNSDVSHNSSTVITVGSLQHLQDTLINTSSLCQNLRTLFEHLKERGEARFLINDWLNCHVSTTPKKVKVCQSTSVLGLIEDSSVMKFGFPADTAISVRQLCESTKVQMPLTDAMANLCLSEESITSVAQHMVYWGSAMLAENVQDNQTYAIENNITDFAHSEKSAEFIRTFKWCPFSFAEILSLFSQSNSIKIVRQEFCHQLVTFRNENSNNENNSEVGSDGFTTIVNWLILHGYIYPVRNYTHYLPFFVRLKSGKNVKKLTHPSLGSNGSSKFRGNSIVNGIQSNSQVFYKSNGHAKQWGGPLSNPTIFYVSEYVTSTLAKIMREKLVTFSSISRLTDIEILHIFLYVKEQLFLLELLNEHEEVAEAKKVNILSKNTKEESVHQFSHILKLADVPVRRIWFSDNDLETDLLKDILDLKETVPLELLEIMRLLIDFAVYCSSNSESEEFSFASKEVFSYLQQLHEAHTLYFPAKLFNSFSKTLTYKQPKVLSSCFLTSFS